MDRDFLVLQISRTGQNPAAFRWLALETEIAVSGDDKFYRMGKTFQEDVCRGQFVDRPMTGQIAGVDEDIAGRDGYLVMQTVRVAQEDDSHTVDFCMKVEFSEDA
jgi:hypothetical protein